MEKENSGIPSCIASVRKHHKQAYVYLSNALQIDECEGILSQDSSFFFYDQLNML